MPELGLSHFDYVVVGGGTSGLLVANRLSQDPGVTVAIIDPGSDQRLNPTIRASAPLEPLLTSEVTNWKYKSSPQEGADGRQLDLYAGKGLGGSSLINGMVYIRGDRAQYDAWEELGNKGWNWNALLPYFKKSETICAAAPWQVEQQTSMDAASYGSSGEMRLGFMLTQQNHTFYQSLQQAWAHLGQKTNPDLNGGVTEGAAVSPLTFDPQQDRRWDAATAFLWPVENRPNLHLLNGTVTRILWKSDGGEDSAVASGVEYLTPKKTRQKIYINREVILSASVYRTPLILERSGVGNPVILSKLGIPLVVDLPGVGENFVDQSCLADEFDTHPNIHGGSPFVSFMTAASLFGANASQIADDVDSQISSWAEQLAAVGPSGGPSAAMLERLFRLQHRLIFAQNVTLSEIFYTAYAGKIISVAAITMPFSRGSIHWGAMPSDDDDMSDRKFMAKVVMNPRYLTNPFDIQNLIATGRLASRLSSTSPLSLLANDDLDKTNRPPSLELPPAWDDSDDAWRQWTSASVESYTHGMGTAAMMAQELGGVVDERLRVYGTRGLRVVDASVLPMQVSGHPMATVYAVAERAAQMIKEDAEN